MHRLFILIALVAGAVSPVAGAFGSHAHAEPDNSGLGIRLVDAPVASRDDPRAGVYIVDHVQPGTVVKRRIEVSNNTGDATDVAVYPAAAAIRDNAFVGLEGDTPNELSTWTSISAPQQPMPDGAAQMLDVTIDVPADAPPGEQYAVLWAQTSTRGTDAITQVKRVGIRVYLSVGPGGAPAAAFAIKSFKAERDSAGTPVVTAMIHNTGGRALDLRGELTLSDGPGGLSAGPFPVSVGTTVGLGKTAPATVELDKQLPNGPWKAHLEVTSGLLTEKARATLTFVPAGTAKTVNADGSHLWWWIGGGLVVVLGAVASAAARRRLVRSVGRQ